MTAPPLMVAAAQRIPQVDLAAAGAARDLLRIAAVMLTEAAIQLEVVHHFTSADHCCRAAEALRTAADRMAQTGAASTQPTGA